MSTTGLIRDQLPESERPWFDAAAARLVFHHNIDVDYAQAAIVDALELARAEASTPEDFHGPAREWADALAAYWRESAPTHIGGEAQPGEGAAGEPGAQLDADPRFMAPPATASELFDTEEPLGWAGITAAVFGFSVFMSAVLCFWFLVGDGWSRTFTPAVFGAPFMLAIAVIGVGAAWDRLRRRFAFPAAVAGTIVVGTVLGGLTVGFFFAFREPKVELSSFAILLPGLVGLVLMLLTFKFGLRGDPSKVNKGPGIPLYAPGAPDPDIQWREEFVRAARARGDRSEREIQQLANEAAAHARESGTTIGYEFGTPQDYAQSLPAHRPFAARRKFLYYFLVMLVIGAGFLYNWITGSFDDALGAGIMTAWFILSALVAYFAWREYRHAKKR